MYYENNVWGTLHTEAVRKAEDVVNLKKCKYKIMDNAFFFGTSSQLFATYTHGASVCKVSKYPIRFTILWLPRSSWQDGCPGIQPVLTADEEGAAESCEAADGQVAGGACVTQTSHTVLREVW